MVHEPLFSLRKGYANNRHDWWSDLVNDELMIDYTDSLWWKKVDEYKYLILSIENGLDKNGVIYHKKCFALLQIEL